MKDRPDLQELLDSSTLKKPKGCYTLLMLEIVLLIFLRIIHANFSQENIGPIICKKNIESKIVVEKLSITDFVEY